MAHNNFFVDKRQIECVKRLSHFHEHIVSNVDYVIYRANTYHTKSVAHPFRRLFYLNIGHKLARVQRANFFVRNLCVRQIGNLRFIGFVGKRRALCLFAVKRRDFSRESVNGLTIGAVCRNGNVQNIIVKPEYVLYVCADFGCFGKNKYSVYFGTLDNGVVNHQLAARAEHAVAHHAAKFAFFNMFAGGQVRIVECDGNLIPYFYVRSSGDDSRNFTPHIDRANTELIRRKVLLDVDNFSDFDVIYVFTCINNFFNLEADTEKLVR